MTIHYVSGLDWSGEAGAPLRSPTANPWLVVAICHCQKDDLDLIGAHLASLREKFHLPANHTFKHARSRPETRREYLRVAANLPMTFTIHAVDKRDWSPRYLDTTSGLDRISDLVSAVLSHCPAKLIERQVLLIDGDSGESGVVRALKGAARTTCRERELQLFQKVSIVPDHRLDAQLVQAADMMAGQIRHLGGEYPAGHVHQLHQDKPKPLA
ncbi:MAG: hypothetical protein QM753_13340 [Thermomicrobiales bacterium]